MSHDLIPPIVARYVRFRPIAWSGWVSMRVELYGCQGTTTRLKFIWGILANSGEINHLTGRGKFSNLISNFLEQILIQRTVVNLNRNQLQT